MESDTQLIQVKVEKILDEWASLGDGLQWFGWTSVEAGAPASVEDLKRLAAMQKVLCSSVLFMYTIRMI